LDFAVSVACLLVGVALLIGLAGFGLVSLHDGEQRAARRALGLALLAAAGFTLATLLSLGLQLALLGSLAAGLIVSGILFVLPIGRVEIGQDTPQQRVDERDIMFARARLKPGSPEYADYYTLRPENQAVDDRTRSKPGLLSPQARYANPYLFASPLASFSVTEALRNVDWDPPASTRLEMSPDGMTHYLKSLARYYGALEVGVAKLQPFHVYSHVGRGRGLYGEPVQLDHPFALAFTVEMAMEMVAAAPQPPISMESAKQYVEAARVAFQLAGALRAMGYAAEAHTDGNYRVIAPLVARDAGLGEIGRMGLLITPRHGPRVRLGVVTTDAGLIVDGRKPDPSVIDFCNVCTKCAVNCPSQSIPFGERQEIAGALRWKINSDTCFHYWNVIGTDCGRCMAVCPYSHPDTFYHRLVRAGIAHSGFFRRAAIGLDNWMYGERPEQQADPEWTRIP
jgi:ferredoxin